MSLPWMFPTVTKSYAAANNPLDKHTIFKVKRLLETT